LALQQKEPRDYWTKLELHFGRNHIPGILGEAATEGATAIQGGGEPLPGEGGSRPGNGGGGLEMLETEEDLELEKEDVERLEMEEDLELEKKELFDAGLGL
jgi:hypothetical protein